MSNPGARFFGSSFVLFGVWFLFGTTLAFADPFPDTTKPHFCKNSPVEHLNYPPPTPPGGYEQISGNSYTWRICRQNSNATEWYFVVKVGTTTVCQVPWNNPATPQTETITATDGFTFTCNTATSGIYMTTVWYKVTGSATFMNHVDYLSKP